MRAVRGSRTQLELSHLLGYRANPVSLWERGLRFPNAADALRICERVGTDVHRAITRFHPPTAPAFELSDRGVAAWLRALKGSLPAAKLATRLDQSPSTVSRWLSGDNRPRLPEFLRLIEAITGRGAEFVTELVGKSDIPSLRPLTEATAAALKISTRLPWTSAVLRMLETTAYQNLPAHQDGWIASRLDIDIAMERTILEALETATIIQHDGKKYVPVDELRVFTRGRIDRKVHWANVAQSRIPAAGPHDLFSYAVIGISREGRDRLRARLRALFREVLSDVADSDAETVTLINLQVVDFDPESQGS